MTTQVFALMLFLVQHGDHLTMRRAGTYQEYGQCLAVGQAYMHDETVRLFRCVPVTLAKERGT